jgi:hypothetical protein
MCDVHQTLTRPREKRNRLIIAHYKSNKITIPLDLEIAIRRVYFCFLILGDAKQKWTFLQPHKEFYFVMNYGVLYINKQTS